MLTRNVPRSLAGEAQPMPDTSDDIPGTFDVFPSHGSPDKPWVRTLCDELNKLGLSAFLDEGELETGGQEPVAPAQPGAAPEPVVLALVISTQALGCRGSIMSGPRTWPGTARRPAG